MTPEITETGPKITDKEIDELEKNILTKIPLSYREFLKTNNGGRPSPPYFPIKNSKIGQSTASVHCFMGIAHPAADILKSNLALEHRIPGDLLPFALNPGGDILCIGWKGERLNKVYIWWHDFEAEPEEYPNYDNIDLIADSFEEFINGFSEYPEK